MRRWVQMRDETCRFPGCNRPAHLCDQDHAHEWQHGGVTSDDNLVCVCRPSHLPKSEQLLHEEPIQTGSVRWRLPWRRSFEDPPAVPLDPAPDDLHVHPDDEPCPF